MNIVRKLTLRHLKENKGRTVITSLGIIIAVAMLTAVFVSFASMFNLEGQLSLIDGGNYHCEFSGVSHSSYQKLKNDSRVDLVGMNYYNPKGEDGSFKLADAKAKKFNVSIVEAVDETLFHQMYDKKFKGTAPKDETQCAVTQEYIDNNKLNWKIGDTISVDIGNVYDKDKTSGEKFLIQEKAITKSQRFEKSYQKKMTLTGIITGSSNIYCDMCRGMTEEEKLADNATVYFTLKKVDSNSIDVIYDIAEKCGIDKENCFPNKGYLSSVFSFSKETLEMYSDVLILGGIMLIIIMVAGVMLIYNSFSMSLANKVRYLGLLSSVGATKKQKRASVYFEGFFLALISIPIGILSGIAGIGITFRILLNKLISSGALFRNLDIDMFESIISVPLWCIVAVIIFAFITIFISAFIPARKASKISPIDAIRQTNEIKLKPRSLKSSKLIRLIFGYEGEIANKNLKRNGKKSKLIVFSIIISVVLFLTVGYFSDSLRKSALYGNAVNYQVRADVDYEESEKFEKDLESVKDIKDYYYGNNIQMYALGKDLYNSKYYENLVTDDYQYTLDNGAHWNLHLIDDESFDKILSDNKIDKESYYGNKIKTLVVNAFDDKTAADEPYFKNSAKGKTITISDFSCEINFNSETDNGPVDGKVEIGDFIKYEENDPMFTADGGQKVTMIAPMSVYVDVVNCLEPSTTFAIITDKPNEVIKNILEISDIYCENIAEETQAMNSVLFVVNVLVYGFIALITLITMFNIINTISTGVIMRRKEFAMLRSVGISKGGYYRIVSFESLLYGVKGLVYGLPIATIICYLINFLVSENQVPFEINWIRYLVVIIAVFAVVGITMLYAVFKTRKNSIIDTLKEDIN